MIQAGKPVLPNKKEASIEASLFVGLPRFELGQAEPKSVVLPLHHKPIPLFPDAKLGIKV